MLWGTKMTEKKRENSTSQDRANGKVCQLPERQTGQFCTIPNSGIVVDVEVQIGDPVDSQIIRNFMGEFELARKNRST